MLQLAYEKRFIKDLKVCKKRNKDANKIQEIIIMLQKKRTLPPRHKNHKLKGDYDGFHECHIEPDWLLIYKKTKTVLTLVRTGTHSDLF